jgi:outer membrane protein assembly factor BamB
MRYSAVLSLALLGIAMAGCSSSAKDYSKATPLEPITPSLKVETQWIAPTGDVPKRQYAQMAPKVVGKDIILTNAYGNVGILDATTLSLKWVDTLEEKLSSNPGVSDGLVLVGTNKAKLIAFDKNSGQERWRSQLSSEMLAAPVDAHGIIITQCVDGRVQAFNTDTGKPLWNYGHTTPALTLRGTADPLVVGSNVVVAFADGKVASLDIKTGKEQWVSTVASPRGRSELERLVDIDGLFQSRDGVIYVASFQGNIAALSAEDGRTLWTRDMSSYTGLVLGEGQIFITDAESHVWCLDTRTGATLWRQDKLVGRELSAPAYLNQTVAVADYAGYVHWLSPDDGSFLARTSMKKAWSKFEYNWPEETEALDQAPLRSVTTPPVAWDNTLLVRDNTGTLAAFHVSPLAVAPTGE